MGWGSDQEQLDQGYMPCLLVVVEIFYHPNEVASKLMRLRWKVKVEVEAAMRDSIEIKTSAFRL